MEGDQLAVADSSQWRGVRVASGQLVSAFKDLDFSC